MQKLPPAEVELIQYSYIEYKREYKRTSTVALIEELSGKL